MTKFHNEGGRKIFTWQKWPNDKYFSAVGMALAVIATVQLIPAHYKLATGKGKMDD